ncbi:MAG: DUF5680 domain-containing protein [Candidatus Nomurabacteria bacterium]|jgi:hypothetical protein|nr:DUF5680 domain-containing protein [Candidatus Nomurabacteria bacterium]
MTDELKTFLLKANKRGYGSADVSRKILANGEHVISFGDSDFEFKDIYYGGEPYSGQEVVFADGRAVWAMQYRGRVLAGNDFAPIYAFLGQALTGTKIGLPRGVDGFSDGDFLYNFKMSGDLDDFSAHETIKRNGEIVYSADFLGGLVDLRTER